MHKEEILKYDSQKDAEHFINN